jgi:hypothetical protein
MRKTVYCAAETTGDGDRPYNQAAGGQPASGEPKFTIADEIAEIA